MSTLIERRRFGVLPDGRPVDRVRLANTRGVSVTVLTYGGILQRVEVPDARDRAVNVTLGFADLAGYLDEAYVRNTPFFGAIIGRYANRIAGGRFTLDGQRHELSLNHAPNSLHGGFTGFHTRLWGAEAIDAGVRLQRIAADGENGFPGTLEVTVEYRLDDESRLSIDYAATTDRPTVVNLTNHAYWNLAGVGTLAEHELSIDADHFTPVDDTLIPTGEIAPVDGTPMDFRRPRAIGSRERYDHNWVLNGGAGAAATLHDPGSGRTLTITTTEPGLQFYSGDMLTPRRAGVALEPQHFPDSPNRPHFPSTVLRPGERFSSRTVLDFRARRPAAAGG